MSNEIILFIILYINVLGNHDTPVERYHVMVPFWVLVRCLPAWDDATECRAGVCSEWPMDTGLTPSVGDDKNRFSSFCQCLIILISLQSIFATQKPIVT